jgi:hypothetical protein
MSGSKRFRFLDGQGFRPPLRATLNAPLALYQTISRKVFHQYPRLPWIPFAAINRLNCLIQSDWIVVEVGSGMSTLWYADRCQRIISIEADKAWFDMLSVFLRKEEKVNVDLRYEWQSERMADFNEYMDESLDLVIIDGGPRETCVRNALVKVKPGGYIYLDNSDMHSLCGNAVKILLDWIHDDTQYYSFYTDFVPGNFFVNQGLLVQRPV